MEIRSLPDARLPRKVKTMPDLLLELFSEEIPARMQRKAAEDLKKLVTQGLVDAGLTYASAGAFSTPRRLTLALEGLLAQSPKVKEERKGPRLDAPEKAIEGFLRSTGLRKSDLDVREEKKGQTYYAVIETPGRPAADIVRDVVESTLAHFPWPKSMRWGTTRLRWVRPLQSILCILSDKDEVTVVPVDVEGFRASDETKGHRFMAPASFSVTGFEDYTAQLKSNFVVLDPEERENIILNDAKNACFANGLELVEDRGLLKEVVGLVEWPVVLMGDIGEEFLELPPEVLQTSMREHQKFFSVREPKRDKIVKFITVANRETSDNGATILEGNQKVLSARLADAKFFWENDLRTIRKYGLDVWRSKLENVTFHSKLGTEADRIVRVAALSKSLAELVGSDPHLCEEAAKAMKADLASEMVYEFPDLQGLMGRYYATAAGLPEAVAEACEAHYAPLGPSDRVPTSSVSITVAIADKIEKLTAFWAINEKPTGSKDPFALRRAALGVIRLILENDLDLGLLDVFRQGYMGADYENLLLFFHDRLKVWLRDQGLSHDIIDAALAMENNDNLKLVVNRARALSEFLATDDGENLLQGFKRANNILTQAEQKDGVEYSFGADKKFIESDEEGCLFEALQRAKPAILSALQRNNFQQALLGLSELRTPVDAFFEAVQVNSDNDVLRRNRLNLLNDIRSISKLVADFSCIEG